MTSRELEEEADRLLDEYASTELCSKCGEMADQRSQVEVAQNYFKNNKRLYLTFDQWGCSRCEIEWAAGQGKQRGNGGDAMILTEAGLFNRTKAEIYTSIGTPEPGIIQGQFFRSHPEGRKTRDPKQTGEGYYR